MPTNADLYAMMYGGKNTDIVSLYFSTLSASASQSKQAERLIAEEIEYLSKAQANYRKELQRLRIDGGSKSELYKTLRQYRGEQERLLKAQSANERAMRNLAQKGLGQKVTVAQLKKKEEEKVTKSYTLSSPAQKELQAILRAAETEMSQTGASANLSKLLQQKTTHQGLPPEQLKVFVSELHNGLEELRRNKTTVWGKEPLTARALQGVILTNTNHSGKIPTAAEIEREKEQKTAEGQAIYAGLADNVTYEKGDGTAQARIESQLQELSPLIEKATAAVGDTKLARAMELQASADLQGYLADVADDYQTNQSAGDYDRSIAESERRELRQLAEREPGLVDMEMQQFLDPAFVEREYDLQQARGERRTATTDDPMRLLLQAPQLDPFSSRREVQQFVRDLKSGLKKDELQAQLVAQNNPDSPYAQAWQRASPEERVLMALLPRAAKRATGDLSASTPLEKKAEQAMQTAGGAQNLDGANIMRLARELDADKGKQAEFATYILAAQRQKQIAPADLTSTISEEITAAESAPDSPLSAERDVSIEALSQKMQGPINEPPTITSSDYPMF
jgi:hypothetical protein